MRQQRGHASRGASSMSASSSSMNGRSTSASPCSSAQSLPAQPRRQRPARDDAHRAPTPPSRAATRAQRRPCRRSTDRRRRSTSSPRPAARSAASVRAITAASSRAGISTVTSERSARRRRIGLEPLARAMRLATARAAREPREQRGRVDEREEHRAAARSGRDQSLRFSLPIWSIGTATPGAWPPCSTGSSGAISPSSRGPNRNTLSAVSGLAIVCSTAVPS